MCTWDNFPSSILQADQGFQLTVGGHQAITEPVLFSLGANKPFLCSGTSDLIDRSHEPGVISNKLQVSLILAFSSSEISTIKGEV